MRQRGPRRQSRLYKASMVLDASALARTGQMLPPYDTVDTIERLTALAAHWDARKIYALGDSFHDAAGPERLGHAARDALIGLLNAGSLVLERHGKDRYGRTLARPLVNDADAGAALVARGLAWIYVPGEAAWC